MKVAFIYLNIDNYEPPYESVPQITPGYEYDVFHFTDENFPPRSCAITPRLQSKIHKFFGWQIVPDYDIYIWVDSGFAMHRDDSVAWLLEQLGDNDIAFLRHPTRELISQEADFIRENLKKSNRLMARYDNELLDELMATMPDGKLYAGGIFAYRNNERVQLAMKEWWYNTSRYHLDDQLSISHSFKDCKIGMIDEEYYKSKYFTFIRGKK
jgi:hypothetical protein